jgi:hypothetical protein
MQYGADEIDFLSTFFADKISAQGSDLSLIPSQWRAMKMLISMEMRHMDFNTVWATMLGNEPYKSEFKDILHLVQIMLVIPISGAECERIISAQNRIKTDERSCLSATTLDQLIRITKTGPTPEQFDPGRSVQRWLSSGQRPRRCNYVSWPTTAEWCRSLMQDDTVTDS